MNTQEIVAKLWNLCNVLRDDGITYHQYVTELTYILFLKMAKETGVEANIPEAYRWDNLVNKSGIELKNFYKELLDKLGTNTTGRIREIYQGSATNIEEPKNLEKIIKTIDELDWYSAKEEGLGNLYEGLLEKNANEKKSGAGQYFTPRVLIIDKIKNSILPILERDYLHCIFEEIDGYLNRYLDENSYNEIIKELPDGNNEFKIVCLVILDEYSNLRDKIYTDLKRYPLIRSRISQINNIYKNPKEIEKDLKRFLKRIEWHINRLYRTRNAIIHSGENPNNLNLLTEHLHNYVDEVLLETMFFLVNTNLSDVSSIFINAKFVMDNIIKLLKKGEKLSEEDIQILMNVMFLK